MDQILIHSGDQLCRMDYEAFVAAHRASGAALTVVALPVDGLVADAELIVCGATEPSASLFIGEQQIPLESDGTFRVHVPFRDGQQLYPIRAVAADGEQERSIRMEFQRSTPVARVNSREAAQLVWF